MKQVINKVSTKLSSVQFSHSVMSNSLQPHGLQHARLPCPSPTPRAWWNSQSIALVMPSNHLILCLPLLLLPPVPPSIRVFSNESALQIRWPKYWSFSFSISLSNEYSGLISFRMNWLDLLAVQGTLRSLLQLHSSKVSNLHHLAFFVLSKNTLRVKGMDDLSHSTHCYMSLYLKNITMTLCQNQQFFS